MPPEETDRTALALDASWALVYRTDLASGEVSSVRRTSIGGVRARANLTRTGVFTYRQADGSARREYRPADEVFDRDSLDSLAHVPLTIGHPSKVTPESWGRLAKGHVGERPHRSGKFVASDVHVEDGDAATKAEKGDLTELSCGYTCHYDPTPGVSPEGEPYDGIMRHIRYNHVALLPKGFGRAGPDVRMHLDADDAVSGESEPDTYVRADNDAHHKEVGMTPEDKLAFDTAQREAREAKERETQARKDAADEKARADKANADLTRVAAENKTLSSTVTKLEEAAKRDDAAEELERRVDATVNARSDAREVFASKDDPTGAKWKHDGKSVEDIKREVLTSLHADMKEDIAEFKADALDAAYTLAMKHFRKVRGAQANLQRTVAASKRGETRAASGSPAPRGDADPDDDTMASGPIADAQAAFEKKQSTRFKDSMRRGRDSRGSK